MARPDDGHGDGKQNESREADEKREQGHGEREGEGDSTVVKEET